MKFLPAPKTFLGYACGISASVFWGFHPVLIRSLVNEGIPPLGVAAFRLLIGSAVLGCAYLITCLFRKKTQYFATHFVYTKYFWLAVVGLAGNYILFHQGLAYTIASDAILLEAFSPVVVLVLIIFCFPDRIGRLMKMRLLPRLLLITVVGSVGSALLIINNPKEILLLPENKLLGDIIEFCAMFFFALYILTSHEVQKENSTQHSLKTTSQFLFFSGLILLPFLPWSLLESISSLQWVSIFVLGIFSTALAYLLWQIATRYLDIVPLALLFSLSSVWNVALESYIFHLNLSPKLVIGALLILTSSVVTQIISSRHKVLSSETVDGL